MRALRYTLLIVITVFLASCASARRKLLFYPTHHTEANGLLDWRSGNDLIGYYRPVDDPEAVWLFVAGNGGQAADRTYALHAFSEKETVYIVEYPGYGLRPGTPSKETLDRAVTDAYRLLRTINRGKRLCVVGESIGSGPASLLAREAEPPDKIVLVVPFDTLKKVASDHLPLFPVGLLLGHSWDNIEALRDYRNSVEIFGARDDRVIPIRHAEALAKSLPHARLLIVPGGHNDWSHQNEITFRAND